MKEAPRAVLIGQYYNNLEAVLPDDLETVGILFKPTVLNQFYGIDMQDITHKTLDAEVVLGKEIDKLTTAIPTRYTQNDNGITPFYLES